MFCVCVCVVCREQEPHPSLCKCWVPACANIVPLAPTASLVPTASLPCSELGSALDNLGRAWGGPCLTSSSPLTSGS